MTSSTLHPSDPLSRADSAVVASWREAESLLESAEHERAADALRQALDLACGDPELEDRLFCAVAALDLELRRSVSLEELRGILMRNTSEWILHLAAYQLGRHFELAEQTKKSLFYARLSLSHARRTGQTHLVARCLNLLGNALVAQSEFTAARAAYQEAVELDTETASVRHQAIQQNLGYCEVLDHELRSGLTRIYGAVRAFRSAGADFHLGAALTDLAFALLSADRADLAARHCDRAIALAEQESDVKALANALFLKAEAASRLADEFATRRACARLAEVTGQPDLSEYVLTTDSLALINLRA